MCLAKPPELQALYGEAPALFELIRDTFDVPSQHTLDVGSVERERSEGEEVAGAAALTLYYVQSLRLLAKRGLRVRLITFVNTSACLHSMLTTLAAECDEPATSAKICRARERIGLAASVVAAADLVAGGGNRYME